MVLSASICFGVKHLGCDIIGSPIQKRRPSNSPLSTTSAEEAFKQKTEPGWSLKPARLIGHSGEIYHTHGTLDGYRGTATDGIQRAGLL